MRPGRRKLLQRIGELRANISATPISDIAVEYRGRTHELALKHESLNPTGSIKDRTAIGLLVEIDRINPLVPGSVIVESTSGNLGLALARLVRLLDCNFIAVIDEKTPQPTRDSLTESGVELRFVDEPDGQGGYLLTRLKAVRELCAEHPEYRWPNQYHNQANPLIHEHTTGPEIAAQGGAALDAVYIAVSTGGTLAGISAHLRAVAPGVRIVAVDATGSVVTGGTGGQRLIAGLGASRASSFLTRGSYDKAARITPAATVAACRMFLEDTGIALGGSSGSVLCGYLGDLGPLHFPRRALCLCPDDGSKYLGTVYDDTWLDTVHIAEDVHGAVARFREDGLRFRVTAS
ncbi:pyridoxal-phosphate dependent enzyme [Streptomyces iconiensis]|uniref:Pyridoxal-phosphate dependent enzyme n=1 Tax=Streptomyces iconiensis TaxID=1384038 RepID=A0ABT7A4M7_9ACTN|nr:pyridoxal-phosphate dependent enzyme [Streptomyces iconiensis]MDJ1136002.1 pyridoxal-phosphate dependent enzyme [Streptomyces iconiensis]